MASQPQSKSLQIKNQTVRFGTSERMDALCSSSVDLIVTSPPYWNLKEYGRHPEQIGAEDYATYLARLNTVWDECFRVARDEAVFVLNVNSRRNKGIFYPIAFDIYKEMRQWRLWDVLIWYIPNALPQPNHYMERLFDNKFEYLLVFIKGDPGRYKFHKPRVPQKYLYADPRPSKKNGRGRCLGNIIRVPAYRPPNVKQLGYHQAAFPEEVVALMLETFTDAGDMVLDPFLGSGTTLKVCHAMNREGIGYEINGGYAELIEQRINETWAVPDWKQIDLIHSTTTEPGMKGTRKIHFMRSAQSLKLF